MGGKISLKQWQQEAIELKMLGRSGRAIARILGRSKSSVNSFFQGLEAQQCFTKHTENKGPRVLFLDIETRFLKFGGGKNSAPFPSAVVVFKGGLNGK